jgi:glycolate oxidase
MNSDFTAALRALFPADDLYFDDERREPYARDESDQGRFPPEVVALARSAAQVSAIFKLCNLHKVPVTPCGARSGKSGGSLPIRGGVALSLEKMDRIKAIQKEDLVVVVEPGVVLEKLQQAVEAQGLFYPPDPNSQDWCTLGGNIAENAGGPRALKYGVTRDYVLGLEWVTPTGEVMRVGKRTIKGVAGYDLVGLFVGSEGTLGVATEITLQLLPLPRAVKTALLIFPSTLKGAEGVSAILAAGLLPRTLELLDETAVRAVENSGYAFPPGTGAVIIAEVDGLDPEALMNELVRLGEVGTAAGAHEVLVAQDESQRSRIWEARRKVSPSLRKLTRFKVSDDIVVPRSQIPTMVQRTREIGDRLGLMVATYGHAGDGNLHANVLYNSLDDLPRVHEAVEAIVRTAVELGGTITGEHGVGLAKKGLLAFEQPPELIALQRSIQKLFDPNGIMNPGKIFPDA